MDKGKLTLLFIRDDSTVRRFRLRPFWLKLAAYLFGCMVVLTAISSYGAYRFWTKYSKLLAVHNQLEIRHHEMQVKLERLANLEKLRQAQGMVGKSANQTAEVGGPAPKPEAKPAAKPVAPHVAKPAPTPQPESKVKAPSPPEQTAGSPAPAASGEPANKMTENQLAALYPSLDKELIEVNNLAIKTFGDGSLKITFDIKNIDPKDRAISGRVNLALITWQGEKLPLEINRSNLSFRIQWFKSMQTTFSLPQGETLGGVYALRVSVITKNDETILQETHPLALLMAKPGA
ncbi:MAG: hypothetical protein AB7D07_02285 [Desulfovibrionaceae bacterium]